jgi:hypothetical protein
LRPAPPFRRPYNRSVPDELAQAQRRATILEALDEVVVWHKRTVIYTGNGRWHWLDITGCGAASNEPDCERLHAVVRNSRRPVPLWDVDKGGAELDGFQPHGALSTSSTF